MRSYAGVVDIGDDDVKEEIISAKETAKMNSIISKLENNKDKKVITKIITDVLLDDNVIDMLYQLSRTKVFTELFSEFYVKNKYGENVINCAQNSAYHRFGVFKHILVTIAEVAKGNYSISMEQKKLLKWTMLLHDIGKPYVKVKLDETRENFYLHEDKSYELSIDILDRFDFDEEEKKIILTLVKYHDKFLNEGELTYENLKFLANELQNKKELFYMLIEVKDADAKAKSMYVNTKYNLTKSKYLNFADEYFANINDYTDDIIESKEIEEVVTNNDFELVIKDIEEKKRIIPVFQPTIDVMFKKIIGYEVFTRVDFPKQITIDNLFSYAKANGKYNKLEQAIFIANIEKFTEIDQNVSNKAFVNIFLKSYEDYINKPRIYDVMGKVELVIEIHGYEKYNLEKLKEIIINIRNNGGEVLFDHFGVGNYSTDDLNGIIPDYIKLDKSVLQNLLTDKNKQKYVKQLQSFCLANNIKLIAFGVETNDEYMLLKDLGIRYMQGYYFAEPKTGIVDISNNIFNLLTQNINDKIGE